MDVHELKELEEHFDARYIRKQECEDNRSVLQGGLHNSDKRLSVIEQQQKVNNWLTAAIAAGIVSLVIKVFLGS